MNRRILAILAALALVAQAPAAVSAEITVTDFDDSIDDTNGSCTLREAIRSANADAAVDACGAGDGSDTILLAAGTYTLELVNGTDEDASLDGDLDVTSELLIRGISPAYTVIDGVSGESKERVLHILGSQEAIIRALRVTGGNADGGDGGQGHDHHPQRRL